MIKIDGAGFMRGLVCIAVVMLVFCMPLGFSAAGSIIPKDGYITINGLRIHYLEWGRSGPPIVLLHGMNNDAGIWKDFAPLLASDYHVFAPDRRGSGKSDKPAQGYNFPSLVSETANFIRHLKLSPVILVGHSFGAEVALMTAAENPNLIRSVILVDGGFRPKRDDGSDIPSSEIEKTSRAYDPEDVYPKVTSPVLLVFARDKGPGAEAIADLKRRGIDYFEEVRKAGQRARELADRKLLHKEVVVIENTSHWVQVDQPKALAEAIRQFLEKPR